jgi:hypothetical protein
MERNEYDKQPADFLVKFGLKFRAVQHADRCPPFCDGKHVHGDRYRVTISRKGGRVSFDFWNSLKDVQDGKTELRPYDVLACISGDVNCPETFEDFCSEYGYEEDSRKAEQMWRRCAAFGRRLRAFFSEEEIKELQEIR